MRQSYKTGFVWLILLGCFLAFYQFMPGSNVQESEKSWDQFVDLVDRGEVQSLTVDGSEIHGVLKEGGAKFTVYGPIGEDFQRELAQKAKNDPKFTFKYEPAEKDSIWQRILVSWLPMLILLVIFFLFMRQLQGTNTKAMSFGKSRARLLNENTKKVTFDDIAGVEEAKEELEEIVLFLKNPKKFTRLGGRIPKGVLLMGPPGTGKTLLARGVAGEAGVPFFSISGSDFVEMFVGVGASRVRDLFEQGKKNAPCIIFIDEIDAVGRHRGAGLGGGHDEREQTLNQLLVEMDGFESNEGVILIAATNRPDVLDPALMRPGRFDRRVVVSNPDVRGREQILQVHVGRVPLAGDVELNVIARGTPGFSGADLENLVNEAALLAARRGADRVDMSDFEAAKDKVMMGAERRSLVMSEEERKNTAYHEAGHTLVARLLPGTDPVHKVTIVPRGRALGLTMQLPSEDRLSMNRSYAQKRLAILMGGRVAEEVTFNEMTNGASNDIDQATRLARAMVCEWGMSDKLGPLAFGKQEEQIFLGRELAQHRDYSEETAIEIDAEVRRLVKEGYDLARKLLTEHFATLKAIAEALIARETLESEDVDLLIRGETLPPQSARETTHKEPKKHYLTDHLDEALQLG